MADSNIILGGTSDDDVLTGTTGNDVIFGQGGHDRISGGDGDDKLSSGEYVTANGPVLDYKGDTLDGGTGNDLLTGGSGNDRLIGGTGSNLLYGGGGFDTAVYAGNRDTYTIAKGSASIGITAIDGSTTDTLNGIQRVEFADKAIAYDIEDNAGHIYRLYRAAFDRVPDKAGLGYWLKVADDGAAAVNIAATIMNSTEFKGLYGSNLSNEQFLTNVYQNVLHRAYDQGGFDYWIATMRDEHLSQAQVLDFFAQSAENRAAVIGAIQNGIEYTPFV